MKKPWDCQAAFRSCSVTKFSPTFFRSIYFLIQIIDRITRAIKGIFAAMGAIAARALALPNGSNAWKAPNIAPD
jgi:hypothetical protein